MRTPAISRVCTIGALVTLTLAGCANTQQAAAPDLNTSASSVEFASYGPRKPDSSGFSAGGSAVISGNSGVFGTTDPITVDNSGPFPDNSLTGDTSLGDLSGADQALLAGSGLDLNAENALLAGITLPGDDGSQSYFDADIGTTAYFDTNSSQLNEDARAILRKQAAWLNVHPEVSATVEGHTDERGTREYNIALGERRASATRGYLTALGVADSRVRKVSYGKERPAVSGSDASAWSRNRRTVTVLDGPASSTLSSLDTGSLAPSSLGSAASSVDDILNDPLLNDLSGSSDSLLNDPLLNDPLLNDI
ncbi:UNVERIFIED_CONTAM: hypothetical protein GTU68_027339 [Idotea baltica]|nr:hypothetical protein [Idotea baltica]